MSELIETRWTRYGKDRVYIRTTVGADIGHIDLIARRVVSTDPAHEAAMHECLARWCPGAVPADYTVPDETRAATGAESQTSDDAVLGLGAPPPEDTQSPGDRVPETTAITELDPPAESTPAAVRDLSENFAGAAARSKRNEVNAQAPVLNFVARLFRVKTDERSWRVGARGEEKVANELAKLGDGWHRLHAVQVGDRGSDIDHVVIGPPGVFTLNTKRHPGGKAWVAEHSIRVNGQPYEYLRNSRHEAERAAKLLSLACGSPVAVMSVIVFVDLDTFTVKQMPTDVHVITRRRLVRWFKSLAPAIDAATVEMIFNQARLSTTWQRPPI